MQIQHCKKLIKLLLTKSEESNNQGIAGNLVRKQNLKTKAILKNERPSKHLPRLLILLHILINDCLLPIITLYNNEKGFTSITMIR